MGSAANAATLAGAQTLNQMQESSVPQNQNLIYASQQQGPVPGLAPGVMSSQNPLTGALWNQFSSRPQQNIDPNDVIGQVGENFVLRNGMQVPLNSITSQNLGFIQQRRGGLLNRPFDPQKFGLNSVQGLGGQNFVPNRPMIAGQQGFQSQLMGQDMSGLREALAKQGMTGGQQSMPQQYPARGPMQAQTPQQPVKWQSHH